MSNELNQAELDVLSKTLEVFENQTVNETGVRRISGGFASAEMFDCDDEQIDIQLKWGVQSDCENVVHTENYRLDRNLLNQNLDPKDILKNLHDA